MVPQSLAVWLQRAGRAGRRADIRAHAILLVQPTVFHEKNKSTRQLGDTVQYVKEIDADLRAWIETPRDGCRRDIADGLFKNPPRQGMLLAVFTNAI